MESAPHQKILKELLKTNSANKVEQVLKVYKDCKADEWALQLKNKYFDEALNHLKILPCYQKEKSRSKNWLFSWLGESTDLKLLYHRHQTQ